ncbi:sulfur oxidation c-type cytochrome SoxA [Undibacterium sp.]|jgi:sulfur-oxidizing protein SoxA|uniref:sulfur oxidation c-type cytochrome SoxA n=1 Tax=Undibacterium sp. TaxID=1914977 RepID=UPI002B90B296|nr:sulfur oxidation c-type cytochrome SoxA [Undibacterium sp.]HTD04093.1 sulfur oxidation c-type cytochrome SoxA [Undibacterium sp.]
MKKTKKLILMASVLAAVCAANPALAQQGKDDPLTKYRDMLAGDNPAELSEMKGEALWKTARGPNKVSLEKCDLGVGAGVVAGAYVKLPRYFEDTKMVQDLESRLVTCMVMLQGMTPAEARKNPFSSPGKPSDMEALASYITSQSRGLKMATPLSHPKEKEAYAIGKQIFYYRAGPYDFSCATCHGAPDKRIRLQYLPDLTNPKDAREAYATWPAYRVSQGEVRTMQHRLNDCFRQQRFPEPLYTSDAITALTMFLARNAEGATYNAPALKR